MSEARYGAEHQGSEEPASRVGGPRPVSMPAYMEPLRERGAQSRCTPAGARAELRTFAAPGPVALFVPMLAFPKVLRRCRKPPLP